jgi:hypothetical protein
MADVKIDFVTDVTYDTVKRLKRASSYPPYRLTNIQHLSRYYTYPDGLSTSEGGVYGNMSE